MSSSARAWQSLPSVPGRSSSRMLNSLVIGMTVPSFYCTSGTGWEGPARRKDSAILRRLESDRNGCRRGVEGRGGRRGGRGTVRWPESCVQARPPKASPKKSQEEERRFYKELIGRCTTPLPRFAKPLVAAYRRYF